MAFSVEFECETNASPLPGAPFIVEVRLTNASADPLSGRFDLLFSSMRTPSAAPPAADLYAVPPARPVPPNRHALVAAHINGDFCRLSPAHPDAFELRPGETLAARFAVSFFSISETDAPSGFYLAFPDGTVVDIGEPKVAPFSRREQLLRGPRDGVPAVTAELRYATNEANTRGALPPEEICPVTPKPKHWRLERGAPFRLTKGTLIVCAPTFEEEAKYLAEVLGRLLGAPPLRVSSSPPQAADKEPPIELVANDSHPDRNPEAYEISVSAANARLEALSPSGAFRACTTLVQLAGNALHPATASSAADLAPIRISDEPRFGYRGLHLDISRNFHPLPTLLRALDAMALYKLSVLQLHFSDDEGWRIEIPGLEELTSVGAVRSHAGVVDPRAALPPAQGSGPFPRAPGTGFLTRADAVRLVAEAKRRHIRVVPEVEMPGHARAAMRAMEARAHNILARGGSREEAEEYLLSSPGDASVYSSAQSFRDNVMCIARPSVLRFVRHVLRELRAIWNEAGAELEMVHLGGDEVAAGAWERDPLVLEELRRRGCSLRELLDGFWGQVISICSEMGIQRTAGWEEIAVTDAEEGGKRRRIVNRALLGGRPPVACVWNTIWGSGAEDLGYRLANAGFPIVLCSGPYAYLDFAYEKNPLEPGLYWGAFTSLRNAWDFSPLDLFADPPEKTLYGQDLRPGTVERLERLTESGRRNVVGVQAQLWSELVRSAERLEHMLMPRLLAIAERAWGSDPIESWDREARARGWREFAARVAGREMPRLDVFGAYAAAGGGGPWRYRAPVPGAVIQDGVLHANVDVPCEIRYRTDGLDPGRSDPLYGGPVRVQGARASLACFAPDGRRGRVVTVERGGDPMELDGRGQEGSTGGANPRM
ncbi:beta-N-acetylglucosaminidase [Hyaloraphidium curvatum]|nr:beta-N-acetylglucosaminidase [Hyaloraphidium curvatum]